MDSAKARRFVYRGLGCCAVALGFIGVLVPGLPTTVFVLAASYCFARSSPSMERWLLSHRWFGPPLRHFRETGGMTRSGKTSALGSMWAATLISAAALAPASTPAAFAAVLLAAAGTLAILFAVRTVVD
jgi:hypothetical protein